MRIYALSDLYVDYSENMRWVLSIDESEHLNDILVLAGDLSHTVSDLRRVFLSLSKKFRAVHFIPGNHALWVLDEDYDCSIKKFLGLKSLCLDCGIWMDHAEYSGVSIVPLYSWYDFSFGRPDRYLAKAWRDFRACKWPENFKNNQNITEYFLDLNKKYLSVSNDILISYSHFLPRLDLMPSYIPEKKRNVYPVLGSNALGEQISKLNPDIHVYGHSHVNQMVEIDNTKYINNAFGYPSEGRISRKKLQCILNI